MTLQNPDKTPVAKDLFTYCTREKIQTWHVVIAHNAQGIVDRVQCKSCRSDHTYRPSKDPKSASTSSSKTTLIRRASGGATKPNSSSTSTKPTSASIEDTWYAGIKKWGDKVVRTYDPTQYFDKGDVFTHEIFGKGVVQLRRENKIETLFRTELKVLPSTGKKT